MKRNSKLLRPIIFVFFGMIMMHQGQAQIAINTDGSEADAQAILDVQSSNKGILVPRISIPALDAEGPLTSPITAGMLVYNTNAASGTGFHYWDGSEWVKMLNSDDIGGVALKVFEVEYEGASLVPDGTSNNGDMTFGNSGSSDGFMNYYEWESSETSIQDYNIYLRFDIPEDFVSWQAFGFVIDYQTDDASPLESCVDVSVYAENLPEPLTSELQITSTSWDAITISAAYLPVLTAGSTAVIKITLYSRNGNAARVGDVSMQYNY